MDLIRLTGLLAILVLLPAPALAAEGGLVASDVVAVVDGAPILRKSLDDVVDATATLSDRNLDANAIQQLRRDALQSLIELELLYNDSQRRGVQVATQEIDQAIARSRERFASSEEFDRALRSKGLSPEQLRRDTIKTMTVEKYLEGKVWRDIQVDSTQARAFYDANQDQFSRPAQVRASHILVKVARDAPPDTRRRAQEKATRMLKELRAGRDFGEVARTSSDDPGSARTGGDIGFFARGDMLPAFEDQAFALEIGETSGVFETELGFDIVRVTDKRPAGVRPFAEVETLIRNLLTKEQRSERRQTLVDELRAKARIEILDPALAPPAP